MVTPAPAESATRDRLRFHGSVRAVAIAIAVALGFFLPAIRAAERPAVRVVSQTVGSDELLLALAAPEQIAALSALSRDPQFSAVAKEAEAFPQLPRTGDVESVIKYAPTLVLCADYSRVELVDQLRRLGVKVIVLTRYYSVEDAFANLRLLARELGPEAEARAERIIADGENRMNTLRERLRGVKPVRVLAPSTYGMIPGDRSTFQDLCEHAGADNVASTLGHLHGHAPAPNEQIMSWPVEVVVLGGDSLEAALKPFRELSPYRFLSAVCDGRAVVLPPWQLSCVTHHRIDAYERLARALHPEVFR
jgi:iron complex transport system substrate-binding protein